MQIKEYAAIATECASDIYQRLFHKRNIIIVSERKVKHLPISGGLQLALVATVATGICWASYSTGSYYAARSALKEQSLALKSMIGNKVESNFSVIATDEVVAPIASSKAALSSVDNAELFARIAELETKLKKSEDSKREFIEKVHEKTASNIDSFENLIEQTGLDVDSLKKKMPATKSAAKDIQPAEEGRGGPYIADSMLNMTTREEAVISSLEELSTLRQIVENLPVRKPIFGYHEMSPFGRRIDPFNGQLAFHSGMDLAGPPGSKIYATADGNVSFTGRSGAYGNMVDIDHGFDITTRYAHLSQILVEDGQHVNKGDVIAIQGSTGRSTGPHLHYEVRYRNQPMDPRNFLSAGRYVPQS